MSIFTWIKSRFSRREKALARYRRGMKKAQAGDFAGAIDDYSVTIQESGIPDDVLAMALYNRALAYSATQDEGKAAEDLTKVLQMPGLPENISVAATQRRERLRRRHA